MCQWPVIAEVAWATRAAARTLAPASLAAPGTAGVERFVGLGAVAVPAAMEGCAAAPVQARCAAPVADLADDPVVSPANAAAVTPAAPPVNSRH